jgi:hypothetical protein
MCDKAFINLGPPDLTELKVRMHAIKHCSSEFLMTRKPTVHAPKTYLQKPYILHKILCI